LYVSCADRKVYERRMKTRGAPSWMTPTTLTPGTAGWLQLRRRCSKTSALI